MEVDLSDDMALSTSLNRHTWLEPLARLLAEEAGNHLDSQRAAVLEPKLTPLFDKHKIKDVASLRAKLFVFRDSALRAELTEAMLNHETSFFRDPHVFASLGYEVFEYLAEQHRHDRIVSVWSGACSTGQEPYSLAMTLARAKQFTAGSWFFRIKATDISQLVIGRALIAKYSQIEVNRGLPAPNLVEFFRKEGNEYALRKDLLPRVDFHTLDLLRGDYPMQSMDLVLLRNVLIYFDLPTRRLVLDRIAKVLSKSGLLMLGAGESLHNVHPGFQPIQFGEATLYRVNSNVGTS